MILLFYSRHRSIFGKRRRIGRIGPEELPKGTLRKALVYGFEVVAGKTNSSFEIQHGLLRATGGAKSTPFHEISNEISCVLGVPIVEPIFKNQVINTAKISYGTIPSPSDPKSRVLGDSLEELDSYSPIDPRLRLSTRDVLYSGTKANESLCTAIIEKLEGELFNYYFVKHCREDVRVEFFDPSKEVLGNCGQTKPDYQVFYRGKLFAWDLKMVQNHNMLHTGEGKVNCLIGKVSVKEYFDSYLNLLNYIIYHPNEHRLRIQRARELVKLGESIYKSDIDCEEKIGQFISLVAIGNFNAVLNNEPLVIVEVVNTNFGKSFFKKVNKATDNEPHVQTSKYITNFLIEHNYDASKTFREIISTNGGVSKSEIEKVRDLYRGELKRLGYKKDDNNDLWSNSH